MLAQRRRRWANIQTTMAQRIVCPASAAITSLVCPGTHHARPGPAILIFNVHAQYIPTWNYQQIKKNVLKTQFEITFQMNAHEQWRGLLQAWNVFWPSTLNAWQCSRPCLREIRKSEAMRWQIIIINLSAPFCLRCFDVFNFRWFVWRSDLHVELCGQPEAGSH